MSDPNYTNAATYYDMNEAPHLEPGHLDADYLRPMAEYLRRTYQRRGSSATVGDIGQIAWIMEESAREIRRLQIKAGEVIEQDRQWHLTSSANHRQI